MSSPSSTSTPPPPVIVKDKVVLVTGANRGIGKAMVDVFLQHGAAKVYAAVRNVQAAKEIFANNDDRVVILCLDLAKPESIQQAAKQSQDVDIVINNGGRLSRTQPLDADAVTKLQEEMQVNCYGLMYMAQAYLPLLQAKSNSPTALVQINSVASFRCGVLDVATYSASKAAAYSMTQALRQAVEGQNVRILSVHPGPIATDMIADASTALAAVAEPPAQVAQHVIQALEEASSQPVFHVFPDSKSQTLAKVLENYTKIVIEQGNMYGK